MAKSREIAMDKGMEKVDKRGLVFKVVPARIKRPWGPVRLE